MVCLALELVGPCVVLGFSRILVPWQGTEPMPPAVEEEVPMIVKIPSAEDTINKALLSPSKNFSSVQSLSHVRLFATP